MPWSALGQYSVPTQPLRVTVALFSSAANDSVLETDQTGGSNVVDAISDYGAPGAVLSTTAEVSDRIVNDWRDLYFDSAGETLLAGHDLEVYSGGTLGRAVDRDLQRVARHRLARRLQDRRRGLARRPAGNGPIPDDATVLGHPVRRRAQGRGVLLRLRIPRRRRVRVQRPGHARHAAPTQRGRAPRHSACRATATTC